MHDPNTMNRAVRDTLDLLVSLCVLAAVAFTVFDDRIQLKPYAQTAFIQSILIYDVLSEHTQAQLARPEVQALIAEYGFKTAHPQAAATLSESRATIEHSSEQSSEHSSERTSERIFSEHVFSTPQYATSARPIQPLVNESESSGSAKFEPQSLEE